MIEDDGFVDIKKEMENLVQSEIIQSGIPKIFLSNRMKTFKLLNDEQKELAKALKALNDGKIWCIVILGSVGNGKTTVVTAFMNEWIRKHMGDGLKARYATLRDLTDQIRNSIDKKSDYNEQLKSCELLVIDELEPSEKVWTEYIKATVQNILVYRHANQKATVLIGNLSGDDVHNMFDSQVLSRLREGYSVSMQENDMRTRGKI